MNNIFHMTKIVEYIIEGVAAGPRHGDPVQGDPAREYGRGTTREVARLSPLEPVRQPAPHQRVGARTGPLSRKLHSQLR